ncbi:hypothetical protein BC830DRAFT_1168568 [Chytriomyces sp. MP71]|nr:hypothetical protein BC830DRAFT_1168568 [Chytriomyces sp. MP71]
MSASPAAVVIVGITESGSVGVPLASQSLGSGTLGTPAVPRFVTGRLRVAAALLPASPLQIRIHLFGSSNGVRDASDRSPSHLVDIDGNPVRDGEQVDISLVVWQGSIQDSLVPGVQVHEFPFSLQIPSNILPSYNFLLSSMPFSQQFDSAKPTYAKRQTRFYELVASVVCADNTLIMTNDPCPVLVKQCFPRWLRGEDKVGRGATAGGEFNVNVTIPRYVFMEDGQIELSVTIQDGVELVKKITAVRCYLVETASFKVPSQHIPIPIPIGQLFRYKVPSMLSPDKYPLFTPQNPLKITLQLAEARPDLNTLLLQLTHSLVFEFVYKTGASSVGASGAAAAAVRARGSPGSVGSSSRAHSVGTSGSTQNSVIIDPLRTIQMIHEALDKRSSVVLSSVPALTTGSDSASIQSVPVKPSRFKASLIVPVRIVHSVSEDDVDLVKAFGGVVAPPVVRVIATQPPPSTPAMEMETILTVRIGYEPRADFVGLDGGKKDLDDQLKMSPGDQVIISDTFDDGWAVGTNLTTSMAGLFPVGVVKFIPTAALSTKPALSQPLTVPMPAARAFMAQPPAAYMQHAPSSPAPGVDERETEKRKLKDQMEQMQQMMQALQMKLESL